MTVSGVAEQGRQKGRLDSTAYREIDNIFVTVKWEEERDDGAGNMQLIISLYTRESQVAYALTLCGSGFHA